MKRVRLLFECLVSLGMAAVLLTGCQMQGSEAATSQAVSQRKGETAASEQMQQQGKTVKMQQIEIRVGKSVYTADLYENETAQAFAALLPLQVTMQELNGNEKYIYLQEALPAEDQAVSYVRAGDLMLFGTDCVVLFYEDFSTSYRYTRIGRIAKPEGLEQVLGTGPAKVTFQAVPTQ